MKGRLVTSWLQHLRRDARGPALIFVATRAAIWGVALLALAWFPSTHSHEFGLNLWVRWDAGWFLRIARHGYGSDTVNAPAFFPLFPGLIAVVGRILGGRYVLAGLMLSLLSCLAAFLLLWSLAVQRLGRAQAERALLYLALFPTALFLQAVYSESLYLLLALAAFAFAETHRWPLASGAAALALLTRSSGVAVVAGVAVLAWPELRALAWVGLTSLAVFALFPLALRLQTGDAWGFLHSQTEWDRQLSVAGPLGGLWDAFTKLGSRPRGWSAHEAIAVNLEDLLFLLLFLALLPFVWRRLGAAYGVFATLSILLPLSFPAGAIPLLSMPRFGLVVFPFFLVLAQFGQSPRAHALILGLSSLLLGVGIVEWVTFRWVA